METEKEFVRSIRQRKVGGGVRGVQIKVGVRRSYVASALDGVRDGEPPISLTDIDDTRVKTVKYELNVSGLCRRVTCLLDAYLGSSLFV